jgi:Ca-activated chloride channel homolog
MLLCGPAARVRMQAPATADAPAPIKVVGIFAADKPGAALTPADVSVWADGVPQQVTAVTPLAFAPLALVIGVDQSASQEARLGAAKSMAKVLATAAARRGGPNRVAVVAFADEPVVVQPFTADPAPAHAAIDAIKVKLPDPAKLKAGDKTAKLAGHTGLWDTVEFISREMFQPRTEVRRVLILLTDGEDTYSRSTRREATDALLRAGVVNYSIGVGEIYGTDRDWLSFAKVAATTGGRAFLLDRDDALKSALNSIVRAINSQYAITFVPTHKRSDTDFHELKIEITGEAARKLHLQVSHPKGYFAPTQDASRNP